MGVIAVTGKNSMTNFHQRRTSDNDGIVLKHAIDGHDEENRISEPEVFLL
jgi:hypothetical protein